MLQIMKYLKVFSPAMWQPKRRHLAKNADGPGFGTPIRIPIRIPIPIPTTILQMCYVARIRVCRPSLAAPLWAF